jgi:hypothetical protein
MDYGTGLRGPLFCLSNTEEPGMAHSNDNNSEGRRRNDAQPLGERSGLVSKAATKRGGERSRRAAGPDGPDAEVVGNTFKQKPT